MKLVVIEFSALFMHINFCRPRYFPLHFVSNLLTVCVFTADRHILLVHTHTNFSSLVLWHGVRLSPLGTSAITVFFSR
jgi:hypothetical protein